MKEERHFSSLEKKGGGTCLQKAADLIRGHCQAYEAAPCRETNIPTHTHPATHDRGVKCRVRLAPLSHQLWKLSNLISPNFLLLVCVRVRSASLYLSLSITIFSSTLILQDYIAPRYNRKINSQKLIFKKKWKKNIKRVHAQVVSTIQVVIYKNIILMFFILMH